MTRFPIATEICDGHGLDLERCATWTRRLWKAQCGQSVVKDKKMTCVCVWGSGILQQMGNLNFIPAFLSETSWRFDRGRMMDEHLLI